MNHKEQMWRNDRDIPTNKSKLDKLKSISKELKDSKLKEVIDIKIKQLENGNKRINK